MWSFPSYPELDPAPPSFAFNDSGLKEVGHFDFLQLSTGHASSRHVQVDKYFGSLDEKSEELHRRIRDWDASHSRSYPIVPSETFHLKLLRLLFLEMEDVYYEGTGRRYKPPIPARICNWLNRQFSVPPVFLGHLARGVIGGTGYTANALFRKFESDGTLVGLEGFLSRTAIWFLHDLQSRASTYVIVNCPLDMRDRILSIATGKNPEKLLQPLFLDVLIADSIAWSMADLIDNSRDATIEYEHQSTSVNTSSGIRALHRLSQTWHILSEDLSNLEERLEYLLKLRSQYYAASESLHEILSRSISESGCGIEDSVDFLLARTRGWKGWAENYNERTKIQINLFFNLSTQADNRTNLEIARLTGDIAVDTQKDSSSMIT
ncbi:hypothetical protein M422DRAFT_269429 [Sphaerobolus stellatus SS14]|uniref:Uncharacterized protein n=1 Tax=Sphaerobolus stellatus (strain SS14) TaxID=990650 RepID=A0A0C9U4P0_SPHS4|nr:hypothetical protein M422DRAFT_269429 [Sphaerobolus stellatus SS14]